MQSRDEKWDRPNTLKGVAVKPPGVMEIVLPSGTTIRTSGQVDAAVLRGVLAELGGR
jgi:hypothetical protein